MAVSLTRVRPQLVAFGAEVRAARLHAEMSVAELARRARLTRQGLVKIERGGNPTLATIVMLAKALRCQVSDLIPPQAPWRR